MPAVILATAGYDHSIKFWEATTGIPYRTLHYHESVRYGWREFALSSLLTFLLSLASEQVGNIPR